MNTTLLTDRYELTMVKAARVSSVANKRAVFELFARKLPNGRRYGVICGNGRLAERLETFVFGEAELAWLAGQGFDDDDLAWMKDYRFRGDISVYPEGSLYFGNSPVVTVNGTFADAVVLETLALSVFNHDSAIAAAALRMRQAAGTKTLIEMGGRRTHEEAAVACARAAWIGGFDATSNLEAGRRYGIPTVGTSAHAYSLAHLDEVEAFEHQIEALGVGTTLLVDTYDIAEGIENALIAANRYGASGPGAIRIDSGDLYEESVKARRTLDRAGAHNTRIVISGDLDEWKIAELEDKQAPVDVYGVGTQLVVGSGCPTASMVYKLVAIEEDGGQMRFVAKKSASKATVGGQKYVKRVQREDTLVDEIYFEEVDGLQEPLAQADAHEDAKNARTRALAALQTLGTLELDGDPVGQVEYMRRTV